MEMVIPIALGVVLGLITYRTDQHWVGKVILLAVIIVLVWVGIANPHPLSPEPQPDKSAPEIVRRALG